MSTAFELHIVFDCADPDRVARFWMAALGGYDFPFGVPGGFATWDEYADAKAGKNRLHLDIKVAPGLDWDARRARIDAEADRLIALGAAVTERFDTPDDIHLILQDPEGNEFCLA
jgi:hypothetical protein